MNDKQRVTQTVELNATPRDRTAEIPWTRSGPLTVSESPQMTPANNITLTGFSARITTIVGGPIYVELRKNGVLIADLELWPGTRYATVSIDPPVNLIGRRDYYSVAVTAAGTGAADLSGGIEHA